LFQPFAFAAGDREALTDGALLSILIPLWVALAELPALSVQVPDLDWPDPSVDTVASAGELATPDRESEHAKLTVTSALFQPFAFAAGDRDALTDGAVLSMLMSACVAVAELPALSKQVPDLD
jgi:hypothetical protein